MPSKSAKQAKTMAAAAHDPAFAKKVGIPQKVAKDFNKADTGTGIRKRGKKSAGKGESVAEDRADKKAGRKESTKEDTMDAQMARLTMKRPMMKGS